MFSRVEESTPEDGLAEMPCYEYKCKKCEKRFEVVHGFDDNVEECEFCGGPVRRVFYPVGIVFKGPGFYATDSRKAGSGRFKHAEEPHESAAKAKSGDNGDKKEGEKEGKKEKKPAEKTKPKPS